MKKFAAQDEVSQAEKGNVSASDPRTSDEIPFGIRAIEQGCQVDGVWISKKNTPLQTPRSSRASSVHGDSPQTEKTETSASSASTVESRGVQHKQDAQQVPNGIVADSKDKSPPGTARVVETPSVRANISRKRSSRSAARLQRKRGSRGSRVSLSEGEEIQPARLPAENIGT